MDINETMENAIEKVSEEAETVREKAEEALNYVAEMDVSTIAKIGVVGGLVGAAAGVFVFKPISDKIASIPSRVKQLKANADNKLKENRKDATKKMIAELQKQLDELEAPEENNKEEDKE